MRENLDRPSTHFTGAKPPEHLGLCVCCPRPEQRHKRIDIWHRRNNKTEWKGNMRERWGRESETERTGPDEVAPRLPGCVLLRSSRLPPGAVAERGGRCWGRMEESRGAACLISLSRQGQDFLSGSAVLPATEDSSIQAHNVPVSPDNTSCLCWLQPSQGYTIFHSSQQWPVCLQPPYGYYEPQY